MAFKLSAADKKLSALDNANIDNPSAANQTAVDTELSRQVTQQQGQKKVGNALQGFSQGVVNFVTGDTPGGGAPAAGSDYKRNFKETGAATADALYGVSQNVKDYANKEALGTPGPDFNANSVPNYFNKDGSYRYARGAGFSDETDSNGFTAPGAGRNQYVGTDSRTGETRSLGLNATDKNGSALAASNMVGNVNPETGVPYDIEQGRAANAIRQQSVDAQPRGAGVVIGGQGGQQSGVDKRREALQRDLDSSRNDPQAYNRAYRGLQLLNDQDQFETQAAQTGENARIYADAGTERARLQGQQGRAQRLASLANAAETMKSLEGRLTPIQQEAIKAATTSFEQGVPAQQLDLQLGQYGIPPLFGGQQQTENKANGGLIESYADGGFVEPTNQRTQGTGAIGSAGAQGGNQASMQRYQQYAAKATEMNLPPLSFNEFATMTAEPKGYAMGGMVDGGALAGQSVIGYADGGTVDVSGEQVIDPNPNAQTDSIPAVIDGQRPAALDSGEFVIPKDVVMYFGTDKLNKMIEKARNPDGGKQQQSTALGGAPAS
jgi:hypothetical protein